MGEHDQAARGPAPGNPYLHRGGMTMDYFQSPSETPSGPGLSAADLHVIAQRHYQGGFREAEKIGRKETEEARERYARIYDDGFYAGHNEGKREVGNRLLSMLRRDVGHWLAKAEESTGKTRTSALARLRAAIENVDQSCL